MTMYMDNVDKIIKIQRKFKKYMHIKKHDIRKTCRANRSSYKFNSLRASKFANNNTASNNDISKI